MINKIVCYYVWICCEAYGRIMQAIFQAVNFIRPNTFID